MGSICHSFIHVSLRISIHGNNQVFADHSQTDVPTFLQPTSSTNSPFVFYKQNIRSLENKYRNKRVLRLTTNLAISISTTFQRPVLTISSTIKSRATFTNKSCRANTTRWSSANLTRFNFGHLCLKYEMLISIWSFLNERKIVLVTLITNIFKSQH